MIFIWSLSNADMRTIAQECDATMINIYSKAGHKKIILSIAF